LPLTLADMENGQEILDTNGDKLFSRWVDVESGNWTDPDTDPRDRRDKFFGAR
jgi:hypothetical protein